MSSAHPPATTSSQSTGQAAKLAEPLPFPQSDGSLAPTGACRQPGRRAKASVGDTGCYRGTWDHQANPGATTSDSQAELPADNGGGQPMGFSSLRTEETLIFQ